METVREKPIGPRGTPIDARTLALEDYRGRYALSVIRTDSEGHTAVYVDSAGRRLLRVFPFDAPPKAPEPEPKPAPAPKPVEDKPKKSRKKLFGGK